MLPGFFIPSLDKGIYLCQAKAMFLMAANPEQDAAVFAGLPSCKGSMANRGQSRRIKMHKNTTAPLIFRRVNCFFNSAP